MYNIFEQLLTINNVSAYKVSKETGIAQSTFSDWKNGRSVPKQEKLTKIADYFNVSLNYLMGIEESHENDLQAQNSTEKELLLLCRKVNDAPDEVREQIVEQFKSTIDIYLKAKGIN